MADNQQLSQNLLDDLRALIGQSRQRVAVVINAEITRLYWAIGKRIDEEVLGQARAEYGKQTIRQLSERLTAEFGKGFTLTNLTHAIEFARLYPDPEIVHSVREQLTWTHLRTLIYVKDELKREFYIQMARLERWSSRTMLKKMDGMLYERPSHSSPTKPSGAT